MTAGRAQHAEQTHATSTALRCRSKRREDAQHRSEVLVSAQALSAARASPHRHNAAPITVLSGGLQLPARRHGWYYPRPARPHQRVRAQAHAQPGEGADRSRSPQRAAQQAVWAREALAAPQPTIGACRALPTQGRIEPGQADRTVRRRESPHSGAGTRQATTGRGGSAHDDAYATSQVVP